MFAKIRTYFYITKKKHINIWFSYFYYLPLHNNNKKTNKKMENIKKNLQNYLHIVNDKILATQSRIQYSYAQRDAICKRLYDIRSYVTIILNDRLEAKTLFVFKKEFRLIEKGKIAPINLKRIAMSLHKTI